MIEKMERVLTLFSIYQFRPHILENVGVRGLSRELACVKTGAVGVESSKVSESNVASVKNSCTRFVVRGFPKSLWIV